MYRSSKTYGHDIGLSACFRQHKADSHCRFFHGYALSVHLEFEADELDDNNWVVDFGSLKSLKEILEDTFDHKLLVATDDPFIDEIKEMGNVGLAQVIEVPATGCEAFAYMIYQVTEQWLKHAGYGKRVRMHHVTVREHGANSATYMEERA